MRVTVVLPRALFDELEAAARERSIAVWQYASEVLAVDLAQRRLQTLPPPHTGPRVHTDVLADVKAHALEHSIIGRARAALNGLENYEPIKITTE
jgi:hypothetical protein